MVETVPPREMVSSLSPSHRPTSLSLPINSGTQPLSALDQAQQNIREVREERIHDLDTALRRLDDERRR